MATNRIISPPPIGKPIPPVGGNVAPSLLTKLNTVNIKAEIPSKKSDQNETMKVEEINNNVK